MNLACPAPQPDCGSGPPPVPTLEQTRRFYRSLDWRRHSHSWTAAWGGVEGQWQVTLLPRIAPYLPAGRALEIGAGHGYLAARLREYVGSLVLVDFDPRSTAVCRELFERDAGVQCHTNDGCTLPFVEDGSVDFVLSFFSLVCADLETIRGYVREIARTLAPDGVAFLHHSNARPHAGHGYSRRFLSRLAMHRCITGGSPLSLPGVRELAVRPAPLRLLLGARASGLALGRSAPAAAQRPLPPGDPASLHPALAARSPRGRVRRDHRRRGPGVSDSPRIEVLGIEAVQVLQTPPPASAVPLLAGKPTIVRVHARLGAADVHDVVQATLRVRSDDGRDHALQAPNLVSFGPCDGGALPAQRRQGLQLTAWFPLPASLLGEGELCVDLAEVRSFRDGRVYDVDDGRAGQWRFSLVPPPGLRVTAVGLLLPEALAPRRHHNYPARFARLRSYLGRLFPVAGVGWGERIVLADPAFPGRPARPGVSGHEALWQYRLNTAHEQLHALRMRDVEAGADWRTHYYGMLYWPRRRRRPRPTFFGAASDVPQVADPAVVAVGPSEGDRVAYSAWYGAHELAHTLGLLHPGHGRGQQVGDQAAHDAYPRGLISNETEQAHGVDSGERGQGVMPTARPWQSFYDLMSYRRRTWISPRSYAAMLDRLRAEEALGDATEGRFVGIVGRYAHDRRYGDTGIAQVLPLRRALATPDAGAGRVTLRLVGLSGAVLGDVHHVRERTVRKGGLPEQTGTFAVVLPAPDEPFFVHLWVGGTRQSIGPLQVQPLADDATPVQASFPQTLPPRRDAAGLELRFDPPLEEDGDIHPYEAKDPVYTVQARAAPDARWETCAVVTRWLESVLVDRRFLARPAEASLRIVRSIAGVDALLAESAMDLLLARRERRAGR